jgi:hypothetical protein
MVILSGEFKKMKWYCNKKYVPKSGEEMLIRTIHTDDYARYFVAILEYHCGRDLLVNWHMANGAHHDLTFEKYIVTHFCPLSPVEDDLCN